MLNVAVIDDHQLFRDGLTALLEKRGSFGHVYAFSSAEEYIDVMRQIQVDIAIIDIEMPGRNGLELSKLLEEKKPAIRKIIVSMHNEEDIMIDAIKYGVMAYLLKTSTPHELFDAIDCVLAGELYFNNEIKLAFVKSVKDKLVSQPGRQEKEVELSPDEVAVLRAICEEKTADEISKSLFKSKRTIEGIKNRLMKKTEAKNLAGLVVFAIKNGHWRIE